MAAMGLALVLTGQSMPATATPATLPAVAAPPTFTHPGVLVSRPQPDFVRGRVNAGAQPWLGAYNQPEVGGVSRSNHRQFFLS